MTHITIVNVRKASKSKHNIILHAFDYLQFSFTFSVSKREEWCRRKQLLSEWRNLYHEFVLSLPKVSSGQYLDKMSDLILIRE